MLSYFHCLAFSHGRPKTIRIRYVWTRIFFLKTEEKISVFKNIRIHLDGALNSPLVDAWRKKLLPVTVLDASIVPDCLCSTRLPFYQYRKSLPVLDTCITFKTVQYIEYNINPIKEFTLNNNSKLCFH